MPEIINFNINIFINIFVYTFAAASGLVIANKIITSFCDWVSSFLLHKSKARYEDKKNLARKILKICSEGSSTGWDKKIENYNDIYFLYDLLEAYDKDLATHYGLMVSAWMIHSLPEKNVHIEDIKFRSTLRKEADDAYIVLKDGLRRWL